MTPPSAAEAREAAREILSRRDYRDPDTPRPLRGVLRQLGEWLEPVGDPISDAWAWLVREPSRYLPLAVLVVLAAVAAATILGRRRAAFAGGARGRSGRTAHEDPAELDRLADQCERAGDLGRAVRLRFRAGLLRLDAQGSLAYRPSLTAAAAARAVPAPTLGALATDFDEIAYGGRPAGEADVAAARAGWPRVLQEARR